MSKTLWRVLGLAQPMKHGMLLAVLLGALTVGSGIALLATSAYLISAAALHPSIAALGVAIVGVRFFGIARGVFRYLERLVSHRATFRLLAGLRAWLYLALEPLVPARLLEYAHSELHELRSDDLLRRMVSDVETLQNIYLRIVAPPVVAASRVEERLPNLLNDITAIVDGQSQADPQFRTNRLYTRLTAAEVRRQLLAQKGYRDEELPTAETIATKLNELGYYPKQEPPLPHGCLLGDGSWLALASPFSTSWTGLSKSWKR